MISWNRLSLIGLPLLFLSFGLIITPVSGKVTATVTIIAEADADVDSTETSANYGGKSYLEISNAENMFQGIRIGYIRFDLTVISGTIDSASLNLYTTLISETHTIGIHACSDISWNELTINYDNKPTYEANTLDTVLVGSASTWYSWTVTSAVTNALSKNKITLVIVVEDQHDTANLWFRSRDQQYSYMEEYRPYLAIETTSAANEATSAANGTTDEVSSFPVFLVPLPLSLTVFILKKRRKS